MNLIVLYGPPGSGKYTLGKKLQKYYSYSLLHNHDLIDFASTILDKESKSFWKFCWKLRLELIKEAVNEQAKGVILTRAGTGSEDEISFFSLIKEIIENSGGTINVIKLECSLYTLKSRVGNESRKRYQKVQTEKALIKWFKNHPEKNTLDERYTITVNNDCENPNLTADHIIKSINAKTK